MSIGMKTENFYLLDQVVQACQHQIMEGYIYKIEDIYTRSSSIYVHRDQEYTILWRPNPSPETLPFVRAVRAP